MQDQIFSNEGVDILPVKPNLMANYGPHQYVCLAQGSGPVKIQRKSLYRTLRIKCRMACVILLLALSAAAVLAQQPQTIESIRVIGNRRIPKETILARLFSHPGDTYDPVSIERDFNSLWNTSYFDDVRIEREDSEKGIILNIFVRERPTIREINYKGNNAVSTSDILDRFKKEKVGLSVEGQYDPTKIKRAETVIKDLLSEHGHQFATIKTEVKTIPPASRAGELQHQGRPGSEGGRDQVHRQPAHQQPDAAPLDEEFEAHRHSLFDHLREYFFADLRRLEAGGGYGAGSSGIS